MNEDLKWLAENVHEWNLGGKLKICAHKRLDGSFFVSWVYPDDFEGYTRAQWQAARDELGLNHSVEPTEKVWRGPEDGLPPVGTVLEAWFDDGRRCWHKAYVVGYHPIEENTLAVSLIGDHESRLIWSDISGIRPIRSEEDKAVEEMVSYIYGLPVEDKRKAEHAARVLYRAGYRKQEDK